MVSRAKSHSERNHGFLSTERLFGYQNRIEMLEAMLRKRNVPIKVRRPTFTLIMGITFVMFKMRGLIVPGSVEYCSLTNRAQITIRKPTCRGVNSLHVLIS